MYYVPRGGTRGGADQFKWDDVKSDKDRECYLGHSLMAPVGRWQKGKDLQWFSKDREGSQEQQARDELQAAKEAEREALMTALGVKVPKAQPKQQETKALKSPKAEKPRKSKKEKSKEVDRLWKDGLSLRKTAALLKAEGVSKSKKKKKKLKKEKRKKSKEMKKRKKKRSKSSSSSSSDSESESSESESSESDSESSSEEKSSMRQRVHKKTSSQLKRSSYSEDERAGSTWQHARPRDRKDVRDRKHSDMNKRMDRRQQRDNSRDRDSHSRAKDNYYDPRSKDSRPKVKANDPRSKSYTKHSQERYASDSSSEDERHSSKTKTHADYMKPSKVKGHSKDKVKSHSRNDRKSKYSSDSDSNDGGRRLYSGKAAGGKGRDKYEGHSSERHDRKRRQSGGDSSDDERTPSSSGKRTKIRERSKVHGSRSPDEQNERDRKYRKVPERQHRRSWTPEEDRKYDNSSEYDRRKSRTGGHSEGRKGQNKEESINDTLLALIKDVKRR